MQALAMPASRYIFGTLPWYSVTMVCAILSALLLAQGEEKRRGLPKDTVVDLALRLIPCGIIGARLYYVAFTWEPVPRKSHCHSGNLEGRAGHLWRADRRLPCGARLCAAAQAESAHAD